MNTKTKEEKPTTSVKTTTISTICYTIGELKQKGTHHHFIKKKKFLIIFHIVKRVCERKSDLVHCPKVVPFMTNSTLAIHLPPFRECTSERSMIILLWLLLLLELQFIARISRMSLSEETNCANSISIVFIPVIICVDFAPSWRDISIWFQQCSKNRTLLSILKTMLALLDLDQKNKTNPKRSP